MNITSLLIPFVRIYDQVVKYMQTFDFVVPLAFRLILAPVLIIAGYNKLNLSKLGHEDVDILSALGANQSTTYWFGEVLGMPLPELMAFMAGWTEFLGGWLLLIGLAVRFVSIPLAITMLVAALTAHSNNGWFAIAPSNPDTSAARAYAWLHIGAAEHSLENSKQVKQRLSAARSLMQEHGHPQWLTEKGPFVVLNNGMEFAITYLFMLLTTLFMGGGRWISIDDWLRRFLGRQA